jgi:hypothetical protein
VLGDPLDNSSGDSDVDWISVVKEDVATRKVDEPFDPFERFTSRALEPDQPLGSEWVTDRLFKPSEMLGHDRLGQLLEGMHTIVYRHGAMRPPVVPNDRADRVAANQPSIQFRPDRPLRSSDWFVGGRG